MPLKDISAKQLKKVQKHLFEIGNLLKNNLFGDLNLFSF